MQPVVELCKLNPSSYGYSIRAPRSNGRVPPHSYVDSGFESLQSCIADVARGLMPRFHRVYVRYEGLCVGERDLIELRCNPMQVSEELVAEYERLMTCTPAGELDAAADNPAFGKKQPHEIALRT